MKATDRFSRHKAKTRTAALRGTLVLGMALARLAALPAAATAQATLAAQAASLGNAAANGDWSEGSLNASGLAAISKTGTTQLRVYFNLDDNDDTGNDYIGWYSGDNGTSANRPQLVVTYQ